MIESEYEPSTGGIDLRQFTAINDELDRFEQLPGIQPPFQGYPELIESA